MSATENACLTCLLGVRTVKISTLKGHEKVDAQKLADLKNQIESDGILKRSIAVDVNTNVVLDGHHRTAALKLLGCSKIPVLFVDYKSSEIGVKTSEKGEECPKSRVIEAALKGQLLSPKSTWHYVKVSKDIAHISQVETLVDVPLERLE